MSLVPAKKPWQSKTLIANALIAVIAFFPSLQNTFSPELIAQILVVVNVVLRLVTKDKLGLS